MNIFIGHSRHRRLGALVLWIHFASADSGCSTLMVSVRFQNQRFGIFWMAILFDSRVIIELSASRILFVCEWGTSKSGHWGYFGLLDHRTLDYWLEYWDYCIIGASGLFRLFSKRPLVWLSWLPLAPCSLNNWFYFVAKVSEHLNKRKSWGRKAAHREMIEMRLLSPSSSCNPSIKNMLGESAYSLRKGFFELSHGM